MGLVGECLSPPYTIPTKRVGPSGVRIAEPIPMAHFQPLENV